MADERVFSKLILTAEQIGQALDRATCEVEVPEWGTDEMRAAGHVPCVRLRAISVQQRDDLYRQCSDTGMPGGKIDALRFMRLMVVYGMVEPQVTEEQLSQRAYGVVDRLANLVSEMSGFGKGAAASAAVTFRPESGSTVSVPASAGTPPAGG